MLINSESLFLFCLLSWPGHVTQSAFVDQLHLEELFLSLDNIFSTSDNWKTLRFLGVTVTILLFYFQNRFIKLYFAIYTVSERIYISHERHEKNGKECFWNLLHFLFVNPPAGIVCRPYFLRSPSGV